MLNLKRMFSVGEKVVAKCTPWKNSRGIENVMLPKEWQVFTISDIGELEGVQLLRFKGFPRALYAAIHFRPLHDEISNAIIKEVGSYPKNIR